MNPFINALKNKIGNEITQEQYDNLVELFKEPEPEPIETPNSPTLSERIDSLENTVLTLLFM